MSLKTPRSVNQQRKVVEIQRVYHHLTKVNRHHYDFAVAYIMRNYFYSRQHVFEILAMDATGFPWSEEEASIIYQNATNNEYFSLLSDNQAD